MSVQFWIRGPQGGVVGPFDAQKIREFATTGQLKPDMDISKDGVAWQNAGKVTGLFPQSQPVQIDDFSAAPSAPPAFAPAPRVNPAPPPVYAKPAFVWDEHGRNLSEVHVYGNSSQWVGPNGITLGQSVSDVEHANHGAFAITGWGWDYGGRGYDWRGGALSRQGCRIFVDFDARGTPPDGESDFMSDSAAIRSANAVVQGVGLAPNE